MRISVVFHFSDEDEPRATTGVEGAVTDFILPAIGDLVRHRDMHGHAVLGRVTERIYVYDLPDGVGVDGAVTVTLLLERVPVH
ncbi:MAG TPA: hypothetical protein VM865_09190 [Acidobacteriaceae bacterium]|jgi:hypothetical protein|nr:hypothetical protein [Acidobacteriaceae bacterium]